MSGIFLMPISQRLTVLRSTPMRSARAACDSPSLERIFLSWVGVILDFSRIVECMRRRAQPWRLRQSICVAADVIRSLPIASVIGSTARARAVWPGGVGTAAVTFHRWIPFSAHQLDAIQPGKVIGSIKGVSAHGMAEPARMGPAHLTDIVHRFAPMLFTGPAMDHIASGFDANHSRLLHCGVNLVRAYDTVGINVNRQG